MTEAIQAFLGGFSFTRSFTHPYIADAVDSLWVLRDAPRTGGTYRTEEWVAYGTAPEEIDRIVRKQTRGRFTVCVLLDNDEPDETLRAEFKAMNYRLNTTEPMMIHSLKEIPHFEAPAVIERVRTQEMAERLKKATRVRQILPEHLDADTPIRQYVALVDDELVGRVASIDTPSGSWCSNMYVSPDFRRRGIARGLLSQMLHEDRKFGAKQAVLLATHAGAKLYPVVGYKQIGTLYIYTPYK